MSQNLLVPIVIGMAILMGISGVSRWLTARYERVQTLCAGTGLVGGGLYMLTYIYEHAS